MTQIETITRKQILHLLEKQQYRCALTGWKLMPETASIDHIVPLSKGGDHAIHNAQIVEWRINQAKGTMTNEEFIDLCVSVAVSCGRVHAIEQSEPLENDELFQLNLSSGNGRLV